MNRAISCGVLSICLILLSTNVILGTKETVKPENRFEGRVLTVYLKGGAFGAGTVLQNVSIEEVAGTKTLVGFTVAHDDDDDNDGLQMYIPWENVLNLYSLTPEQAEAMKSKFKDRG